MALDRLWWRRRRGTALRGDVRAHRGRVRISTSGVHRRMRRMVVDRARLRGRIDDVRRHRPVRGRRPRRLRRRRPDRRAGLPPRLDRHRGPDLPRPLPARHRTGHECRVVRILLLGRWWLPVRARVQYARRLLLVHVQRRRGLRVLPPLCGWWLLHVLTDPPTARALARTPFRPPCRPASRRPAWRRGGPSAVHPSRPSRSPRRLWSGPRRYARA